MDLTPHRPPEPTMLVWLWWIFLAGWGGVIGHLRRLSTRQIVVRALVVDVGMSILAGLVSAYGSLALGLNLWWTFAVVALSGHLGARGVVVFEQVLLLWIRQATEDPER